MSYAQAMKWARKHPRGTRQPVLMHTNSGFWPSGSYIKKYLEYRAACEAINAEPLPMKAHYDLSLMGCALSQMSYEEQAAWTKAQGETPCDRASWTS